MSLFPPPDKNGQIKFVAAKGLAYKPRMVSIAALLLLGLGAQITFSFWVGLAALAAASLLGIVQGYDARPKKAGEIKWERVTPDEYAKIKLKAEELERWDEDAFDITNTAGAVTFLLACAVCAGLYLGLANSFGFPYDYWMFAGLDAGVMLLPLWFTGVRGYLRKNKLVIKIDLLEHIMRLLSSPSEVQVFPMLALAGTESGGKEPEDARLMVKLIGAPDAFFGMQVQISINTVQGRDYPYLYCVLISKSGSGLLEGYARFVEEPKESIGASISEFFLGGSGLKAPKLVYEEQKTSDADILVIRQYAGKNTGYATAAPAAGEIVSRSLELAKKLVKSNVPSVTAPPSRY